jgi:chorismate--pyruvate lyase
MVKGNIISMHQVAKVWYATTHLFSAPFAVPANVWDWLTDAGSLVERLRAHGVEQPRILWVQQAWQFPLRDECRPLRMKPRCYALIREVLIGAGNKPCVFARTVFPQTTLTGAERALAHLGTRTLGSVLFQYPDLKRSEFEVAYLLPGTSWQKIICQHVDMSDTPLWARRSIFTLAYKPMLVAEIFLPGFIS